jgi:hypothetical protein
LYLYSVEKQGNETIINKNIYKMNHFEEVINEYLENRAKEDELFAPRLENPNKNIQDCCTFITNEVQKTGRCGFSDDEIFNLAVHYYDEGNIEVGKAVECKVIVNKAIELTEEEKRMAHQDAIKKYQDEKYYSIKNKANRNANKKAKVEDLFFQEKQLSLF